MSGRLLSWSRERARATSDGVAQGALVSIDGEPALVIALYRDHVELAPLSPRSCEMGAQIVQLGEPSVAIPDSACAIDCLGAPLDGGPALAGERVALSARDPVLVTGSARLTLGTLVYDLQHSFRAGTSFLAIGAVGVMARLLPHHIGAGRPVIAVGPGWGANAITVTWPDDAVPAQRWLAAWTAMAIANTYRVRGHHAVLALDLDAWQPSPLGTPRDVEVAQLASRSYQTGEGSVSVFAVTAAATLALCNAFDQVIELGRIATGDLPPLSTKLARPPFKIPTMGLLDAAPSAAAMLRYDPQHEAGHRMRACLRSSDDSPTDSLEQQLCLLAITVNPAVALPAFLVALRRDHAGRLTAIRTRGKLDLDDERTLLALARCIT